MSDVLNPMVARNVQLFIYIYSIENTSSGIEKCFVIANTTTLLNC